MTSEKSERCSKLLHPYSTRSKLLGFMPQESWRMEESLTAPHIHTSRLPETASCSNATTWGAVDLSKCAQVRLCLASSIPARARAC